MNVFYIIMITILFLIVAYNISKVVWIKRNLRSLKAMSRLYSSMKNIEVLRSLKDPNKLIPRINGNLEEFKSKFGDELDPNNFKQLVGFIDEKFEEMMEEAKTKDSDPEYVFKSLFKPDFNFNSFKNYNFIMKLTDFQVILDNQRFSYIENYISKNINDYLRINN